MATPGGTLRSFAWDDWVDLATKLGVGGYVYDVKFQGGPDITDHRLVCVQPYCTGCVFCVRRDSRHEADDMALSDFFAITTSSS